MTAAAHIRRLVLAGVIAALGCDGSSSGRGGSADVHEDDAGAPASDGGLHRGPSAPSDAAPATGPGTGGDGGSSNAGSGAVATAGHAGGGMPGGAAGSPGSGGVGGPAPPAGSGGRDAGGGSPRPASGGGTGSGGYMGSGGRSGSGGAASFGGGTGNGGYMGSGGRSASGGAASFGGTSGGGGGGEMTPCPPSPDGQACSARGMACTQQGSNDGACVCTNARVWSCVSSSSSGGVTACPDHPRGSPCVSGVCAGNGVNVCLCLLGGWQCLLGE